jgi:hypothetical protein
LPTHRGTTDSLDTTFYWVATSGDGNLTNSDFESPAERISDAVMPVPPSMPIGADGTFSFSVLDQIRAAASNGHTFFAIQGRVDEGASGPARGLEIRTTASGNVSDNDVPMLALATPGVTAPLLYRITSLPLSGLLRDSTNVLSRPFPTTYGAPASRRLAGRRLGAQNPPTMAAGTPPSQPARTPALHPAIAVDSTPKVSEVASCENHSSLLSSRSYASQPCLPTITRPWLGCGEAECSPRRPMNTRSISTPPASRR